MGYYCFICDKKYPIYYVAIVKSGPENFHATTLGCDECYDISDVSDFQEHLLCYTSSEWYHCTLDISMYSKKIIRELQGHVHFVPGSAMFSAIKTHKYHEFRNMVYHWPLVLREIKMHYVCDILDVPREIESIILEYL